MSKIRICVRCKGRTNNPDKKGRCPFCSKKKLDWEDCICNFENSHSPECRKNHRKNQQHFYSTVTNKIKRHKLRKQHRCIICKTKVRPKIIYHQYCPKHKPKM